MKLIIFNKLFVLFAICIITTTKALKLKKPQSTYLQDNYPADVIEEARLDTPGLIRRHDYPVETHTVTTRDDYILTLHRIPPIIVGRPVLLIHDILDSSATWVLTGPQSGLAYYLSDMGYDVWLGNVRGNRYSRNHTIFNPDTQREFWSFSWHEIGVNDLPAMIDYVLDRTSHQKLFYIGHSQGATAFLVLTSELPEYNQKVGLMTALNPVAFLKNAVTPLLRLPLDAFHDLLRNFGEVLPHSNNYLQHCFNSHKSLNECLNFLYSLGGTNPQLNSTLLPAIFGQYPAGANLKQWLHYKQLSESDKFRQYDYGSFENFKMYRSFNPPEYPIEKCTTPISLLYVQNDNFAAVEDVQRLAGVLPNVIQNKLYSAADWNHYSLVWGGIEVREQVYASIVTLMSVIHL